MDVVILVTFSITFLVLLWVKLPMMGLIKEFHSTQIFQPLPTFSIFQHFVPPSFPLTVSYISLSLYFSLSLLFFLPITPSLSISISFSLLIYNSFLLSFSLSLSFLYFALQPLLFCPAWGYNSV